MPSRIAPTSPDDPSLDRPRIRPGVPVVWRSANAVQVRVDPRHALVIEGPDERIGALICSLDGTRTRDEVIAHSNVAGIDTHTVTTVLSALEGNGSLARSSGDSAVLSAMPPDERARVTPDLMVSALTARGRDPLEVLHRRGAARVEVRGTGRLGAALTGHLMAAGVGTVLVTDASDQRSRVTAAYDLTPSGPSRDHLGLDRVHAIASAASRFLPSADTPRPRPTSTRRQTPRRDLVINAIDALGDFPIVDPGWADELICNGTAHLNAAVAGPVASVGALVIPGASACQRCLDLTRADRDPGWPHVLASLAHAHPALRRDGPAVNVVLATMAAAVAAEQALEFLDGHPPTALATWNAVLILRLPGPSLTTMAVTPHPECGCSWGPPDRSVAHEPPQWSGE
jgi:hypothetical protein